MCGFSGISSIRFFGFFLHTCECVESSVVWPAALLVVVDAQLANIRKVPAVLGQMRIELWRGVEGRNDVDQIHVRNVRLGRWGFRARLASNVSLWTRTWMRTNVFSVHHVVGRDSWGVPG
jgi:hypothetical protein